jgi:pimeloyl-ACP methyl ester carboxylesterase
MELSESYLDSGEVRLHVMEGPENGPPLVLLHGASGSWQDWQPMLPLLVPHWHVTLPDLRGHGLSEHAREGVDGYYISAFVRDTMALLRERVGKPAVLFGHSWGAVTSLLTAAQMEASGPGCLRAVVAEDPPVMIYRNPPELAPFLSYFGWVLEVKQNSSSFEAVLTHLRQMNATSPQPMPEAAVRGWADNLFHLDSNFLRMVTNFSEPVAGVDFKHAFEGIHCPALLLQADPAKGAAFPDEDLRLVQAQVPTAQHVYFSGVGHGIHAAQPQKVSEIFEKFIRELGN